MTVGKIDGDILERFVVHQIDGLDLERLHEALCLGIVVGIPAPTGSGVFVNDGAKLHSGLGLFSRALHYWESFFQRYGI